MDRRSDQAMRDRAAAIFFGLSQLPPEERAAAIDAQCGSDAFLRAEVDNLLGALDLVEPTIGLAGIAATIDGVSQPGGAVIGDFVVIRQIGSGATGVVHLAQQLHPPRLVALK